MEATHEKTISDYIAMFWRRRLFLVVPAAVVFVLGIIVVQLLPPMYKSEAVVLIESQQVPDEFVRSTITSYADERIEVVRQRVLTTANMLAVIKKFDLYPEVSKKLGPTELADRFKESVFVETVSAQGGGKGMTIAFTLSFEERHARKAYDVTNELLTLFLGENVRNRSARAAETTEFLRAEADRLQIDIKELEGRIADFKQQNREALPELAQANTQELDRLNSAYREIRGSIEATKGKVNLVESQLALVTTSGGQEKTGGTLWELEQQYAQLLTRYTEKHPEAVALKDRIAEMRNNPPTEVEAAAGESPATLQLRSQLNAAHGEARFLVDQRAAVEKKIAEVQQRISRAPKVEQDYNNLLRDLDNLRNKYQELRDKELEAKIAQNLEEGQMGERFSVVEPPRVPEKPFAPDRMRLNLLVVALALGCGAGLVFLLEMLQPVLWGQGAFEAVLGGVPLGVVPVIDNGVVAVKGRVSMNMVYAGGAVAGLLLLLAGLHFLVNPLDVLVMTAVDWITHL